MQTIFKNTVRKAFAVLLAAVITAGVIPVILGNDPVAAAAITTINNISISGVTVPEKGKTATTAGITTNASSAGYTVHRIMWSVNKSTTEFNGTFEAGETYRLYFCFLPSSSSYAFPSDVKNDLKVTINGKEYVTSDSYQPGTACFWGDSSQLYITVYYKVPTDGYYNVSFDSNGGSGRMSAVSVEENGLYTLPECGFNPPDSGKEFYKWQIDSEYYLPGEQVKITKATTVKATWIGISTFEVNYDLNGHAKPINAVSGVARNSRMSDYFQTVEPYDGWTFEGWYKDPDYTKPVRPEDRITGNKTLYALLTAPITHIEINNITLPKPGERPTTDGITTNAGEAGYTVVTMCWVKHDGTTQYVDTYAEGEVYRLYINLVPSDKTHCFPDDVKKDVTAVFNGAEYVSSDSYQLGTACFWDNVQGLNLSVYYKAHAPGWDLVNGQYYYYDSDSSLVTGWKEINGSWYFFDKKGIMQTGWQEINSNWYYLGSDGVMLKDWQKIEGYWYYLGSDGAMKKNWQQLGGIWYYLGNDGAMRTSWQQISGKWYYFKSNGSMVTGWQQIGGVWYFFKSNGAMAAKEFCDGYWLNEDGSWTYKYRATWRQDAKGWWYGDDSGWYAKNATFTIDGYSYTFDSSGYWKK